MTIEQLEQIKLYLARGRDDFVDPANPVGQQRKFEYASKLPEVANNAELAYYVVAAFPEFIKNISISEELRGNGEFMYKAFRRDIATYKFASEEITKVCGAYPTINPLVDMLNEAIGLPPSKDAIIQIGTNLEAFAKIQKEQQFMSDGLTTTTSAANKPKQKFKL